MSLRIEKKRLIALQKKIAEKKSSFQNEKELLSPEERQKVNISLERMQNGMNALEGEFRTDFLMRQKEELDQFFNNVRVHVKKISKERKFIIVIQKECVFLYE